MFAYVFYGIYPFHLCFSMFSIYVFTLLCQDVCGHGGVGWATELAILQPEIPTGRLCDAVTCDFHRDTVENA